MLPESQYNYFEYALHMPQICYTVCTKKSGQYILFAYNNLSIPGQVGLYFPS